MVIDPPWLQQLKTNQILCMLVKRHRMRLVTVYTDRGWFFDIGMGLDHIPKSNVFTGARFEGRRTWLCFRDNGFLTAGTTCSRCDASYCESETNLARANEILNLKIWPHEPYYRWQQIK